MAREIQFPRWVVTIVFLGFMLIALAASTPAAGAREHKPLDDETLGSGPILYIGWAGGGPVASLAPLEFVHESQEFTGAALDGAYAAIEGDFEDLRTRSGAGYVLRAPPASLQLSDAGLQLLAMLADDLPVEQFHSVVCVDNHVRDCTPRLMTGGLDTGSSHSEGAAGGTSVGASTEPPPSERPASSPIGIAGAAPAGPSRDGGLDLAPVEVAATAAGAILAPLMLFTLYSRLKPSTVLENETRREILDLIRGQPGITYQRIAKKVGVHASTVRYHVSVLEEHKMVLKTGQGRGIGVYPVGHLSEVEKKVVPLLRSNPVREILGVIVDQPGVRQASIARQVGKSDSTVAFHIQRLARAGAVDIEFSDPPNAKRIKPAGCLHEVFDR